MAVITLLTDFGTSDGYVGAMRGVIVGINPQATVLDICHDITAQDVPGAAFVLSTAYRYYPPDTIHLVVVDPGVGSSRRAIAVRTQRGLFVAPDNGVLSYVYAREPGFEAVQLTEQRYWLSPVSDTFHGRDVFAPVAAHLSRGVQLCELGPAIDNPQRFALSEPEARSDGSMVGQILYIDRFGNLVTNVRRDLLPAGGVSIHIAGQTVNGPLAAYAGAKDGEVLALVGSHGYLELAVRNGSAAQVLGVVRGAEVRIQPSG